MKIHKQLVKRNIAGDVILVPVGDASLELKGLLTNMTSSRRFFAPMWMRSLQSCASLRLFKLHAPL